MINIGLLALCMGDALYPIFELVIVNQRLIGNNRRNVSHDMFCTMSAKFRPLGRFCVTLLKFFLIQAINDAKKENPRFFFFQPKKK